MRIKMLLLSLGLLSVTAALGAGTAQAGHQILNHADILHGGLVNVYAQSGPAALGVPCVSNTTHNPPLGAPAGDIGTTGCGPVAGAQMSMGTDVKADPLAAGEFTILVLTDNTQTPAYDPDVALEATIKDVNCKPAASLLGCGNTPPPNKSTSVDYNPQATQSDGTFVALIRITDNNCVSGNHCTVFDLPFDAPLFCEATPTRPDVGSDCRVQTTANSVVPGVVPNTQVQSNIQVFRVRGCDNGTNGVTETPRCTGDDRLVLQQGLWLD